MGINKLQKYINKTTIIALIVTIEFVGLYFAYNSASLRIVENKDTIKDLENINYEINQLNTTIEQVGSFIDKRDVLTETFVKPQEFESILKEIEAIRKHSGVVDIDISIEEGYNVNSSSIDIRSHQSKDYKTNLKDVDIARIIVTIKGSYDNSFNFIQGLENSKYMNRITSVKVSKETILDPRSTQIDPLGEYIETMLDIEYYFNSSITTNDNR